MSILDTVVDRGYYGFADNDMGRVAVHEAIHELADLRATVAALTAERDAAYRRGWEAAIEAAVVFVDDYAVDMLQADGDELDEVIRRDSDMCKSIRALQPPTAPTEHDAATLEAWHEQL